MTKQELQKWEPSEFDGSDLLPVIDDGKTYNAVPVIEEDDVEAEDMVLPVLKVLHGTSDEIMGQLEGAVPGKLFFSGNQSVIEPPARIIVVHRFRGNALFPQKKNPAHEGLEACISRDGVTGSKYGACETCKKCTEWGPDNEPPAGSKTQQFVVLTSHGLCMFRVQLSNKFVTKATREFMTRRTTTGRNWFCHPSILTVQTVSSDENTWFSPKLCWQESEIVPPAVQKECHEWYEKITDALEHGRLSEDEETESGTPDQAAGDAAPDASPDIPF